MISPLRKILPDGAKELDRCDVLIRIFYVYGLASAFSNCMFAQSLMKSGFAPRLRVGIVPSFAPDAMVRLALAAALLTMVSSLVLVAGWRWRPARIMFFAGSLMLQGIVYAAQGKIDHATHSQYWISFVLIFLPPFRKAEEDVSVRRAFITIFWTATAMVLLLYSCAGISKLIGGYRQLNAGRVSWFSPLGLAQTLITDERTPWTLFGLALLRHPVLCLLGQVTVIYVELFAIVAAFRPRLLRAWGVALIVMHLGILFTQSIDFSPLCFTVGLFVVAAPFDAEPSWQRTIGDLPILGRPAAWLLSRSKTA